MAASSAADEGYRAPGLADAQASGSDEEQATQGSSGGATFGCVRTTTAPALAGLLLRLPTIMAPGWPVRSGVHRPGSPCWRARPWWVRENTKKQIANDSSDFFSVAALPFFCAACAGQEAPGAQPSVAPVVPLLGPSCPLDLLSAKMVFMLCGSVFPHPLLLCAQLLGIEDQDFADFQQVRPSPSGLCGVGAREETSAAFVFGDIACVAVRTPRAQWARRLCLAPCDRGLHARSPAGASRA